MDKPHKRTDTPIIRDKMTKKRLLAYELHIKTIELTDNLSQTLRKKPVTPLSTTRSLPMSPELESLRLVRVSADGQDYYVKAADLSAVAGNSPQAEPRPSPQAHSVSANLLDLATRLDTRENHHEPQPKP